MKRPREPASSGLQRRDERTRGHRILCRRQNGDFSRRLYEVGRRRIERDLVNDRFLLVFREQENATGSRERRHGFTQIDSSLRAAVRVSAEEDATEIVPTDERPALPREEDDFRSMLVEVEAEDRPYSDN